MRYVNKSQGRSLMRENSIYHDKIFITSGVIVTPDIQLISCECIDLQDDTVEFYIQIELATNVFLII